MPSGGGYAVNAKAARGLRISNVVKDERLIVKPSLAQPSYCSGATYLVFLKAVSSMQQKKTIALPEKNLQKLVVRGEADGHGVWGRWNANGPGVAKLFHDLGIGYNFEDPAYARPGDFMKIFWKDAVGKNEFGHLVIYLGRRQNAKGEVLIKYWSSNQPDGYGVKETPASKMSWVIFSRLHKPQQLTNLGKLPKSDPFLVNMLKKDFSRAQVRKAVGMRGKTIDGPWHLNSRKSSPGKIERDKTTKRPAR